jgi:hypothetical protein
MSCYMYMRFLLYGTRTVRIQSQTRCPDWVSSHRLDVLIGYPVTDSMS